MKTSKKVYLGNIIIPVVLTAFGISAGGAFAYKASRDGGDSGPAVSSVEMKAEALKKDTVSKAILSVDNMSCSGCIATIQSALAEIEGIREVVVDVADGKADIYYDSAVLKDLSIAEKAITRSGYPAEVLRTVSAEEVRREADIAAAKSKALIASVNGRDIARADFDVEMSVVKKGYAKAYGTEIDDGGDDRRLLDQFKTRAAVGLVNEGIMLQAAEKSGIRLYAGEVDAAFEEFARKSGKSMPEMKASLTEAGYEYGVFMRRFESTVLINKFIDEKILSGQEDPDEKRRVFTAWFSNAKRSAEVVYYDKEIERLVKGGSGSGSCCANK